MDRETSSWIIPVLLAVAVAAGAWYYWHYLRQAPTPPVETPPVAEPVAEPEPAVPQHPMPDPEVSDRDTGELRELPSLDDSDEYLKLELSGLLGSSVGELLVDSRIIEKVVATVDNLPRSHVAEKIRPVGSPGSPFVAEPIGENLYAISESSYQRYDALVDVVAAADVDALVDLYRRYYPLFQDAYLDLGYPDGYFNDRLVAAIDDMLATPVVQDPVYLVRPHVLFQFEDPDLESRSSGQKLLLRMGSNNAARIKEKLRQLRVALVAQ